MKIIVFLANGFEEVEALTVVDYLRRKEIQVDMVSISDDLKVTGANKIQVIANKLFEDLGELDQYDGLVIPGGMPGSTNLKNDNRVTELVEKMNRDKKLVAAICAGPIVLNKAGIIKGKKVTSYPGFSDVLKETIYLEDPVVRDGNIITSRGPYLAVDFAIEIIDYLLGPEKAKELKESILYI